jgi:hypothetical protein
MPRRQRPSFDYEREIAKLREALFRARSAVIDMVPPKAEGLFGGVFSCQSRDEALKWFDHLVVKALEIADSKEARQIGDWGAGARAFCPLCGDGSSSPYAQGFAYPEGLRRHLDGSYNARQCRVTEIALELAIDGADDPLKLGPIK